MALNYVTVTGTFDDGTGTGLNGTVTFTPSETVYAAGIPVVSVNSPIAAIVTSGTLHSPSGGTLQLLATDNTGLTFEGLTGFFYWTVSVGLTGQSWAFFLPSSPSTVDLFALANTVAAGGGLSILTTLGDTVYENAAPAPARLAGNTASTKKFLTQTGTGTVSAAPAWGTIQLADLPAGTGLQAWQFQPETYGAKGDVKMIYDAHMDGSTAILTTAGLPAPSSWPAGSQITGSGSGGSLAAGVYQVEQTYVNQFGETLGSTAASYTASGSVSSIVANSPAPWTNATGFNVYCTVAGGSTFFKQTASPVALRSSYTITTVTTGTANPPGANTSNSAPFTSADVGKAILVPSAGGFINVPLKSTIASFQSSSQVTLANVSSRAVTGEGAVYGTDDTSAVQSCINAAVTYAQTAGIEPDATVDIILNNAYAIAATPGGTNMAAQLQLPYVNPYVGPKVNLRFVMPQEAPGPTHWEQPNPPMPRGTLVSLYYNDSSGGIGPPPAVVVGSPVTGFGQNGGKFSNMRVSGDLNFLVAYRSCVGGLDLFGCAQSAMRSVGYFCMAATATAGGGWPPYISGTSNPSAWQTFAYRTPTTGNNAQNECDRLTAYGPYHGVIFTDHFAADSVKVLFAFFGATAAADGSPTHHAVISSLAVEASGYGLYWDNSGTYSGGTSQAVFVGSFHSESLTAVINDPGNFAQGEVHAEQQNTTGQVSVGKVAANGANIRLVWDNQALGHVSSPPAVPASGTALTNTYYQPAAVSIHTGGGVTVSAITLDGTATGQTMAVSSSLTIPVRNGGTIALTYAGGTPTWDWWIG